MTNDKPSAIRSRDEQKADIVETLTSLLRMSPKSEFLVEPTVIAENWIADAEQRARSEAEAEIERMRAENAKLKRFVKAYDVVNAAEVIRIFMEYAPFSVPLYLRAAPASDQKEND